MSTEVTIICDRCGARHVGNVPLGWQKDVDIKVDATGLPTYSPYHVDEVRQHLCEACMSNLSDAVKMALKALPSAP